jgi:hypothetical protein
MRIFKMAAAAFSLALLTPALLSPAMADGEYRTLGLYGPLHGVAVTHSIPAQDFDHFDFGIARPTYHSGWGGPYGDGDYPGTVDQNMGPPYLAPHAYH